MNIRRVGLLLFREMVQGPKNFIFVFAVVVPLAMSLVMSLIFGTLFSGKPRLGIAAATAVTGGSAFTRSAAAMEAFVVREYASESALREATRIGAVDVGVALPADFDQKVAGGQATTMVAYIWGESLVKDRALLAAAMAVWVRQIAGQNSPVEIVTTVLGQNAVLPWEDRLLPAVLMMTLMFSGVMLPASSLVTEKQKRTIVALAVTPATMGEVYAAKGLVGVIVSTAMTLAILALNRALSGSTALLAGLLALGAVLAVEIGLLIGMLVKDINSLFAVTKSLGVLLTAPALIQMFPQIPQWIARLFPTYYIIQPALEIAQHGAGLADVAWQLGILGALIVAMGIVLAVLTQRLRGQE
ncbi:MAG: ABC transporter permease [Anaerolineae bacterium]|nr:ABC transporter permease [Anaerolineae bacterium]